MLQAPIQALHTRLVNFVHDVKLSDVVLAGHKSHVPSENVGCCCPGEPATATA